MVLPRRYRTTVQTVPQKSETEDCTLFTKQCIHSYSLNWNIVHYKYSAYSGTYAELPKLKANDLKEETYEIDVDTEAADELKSRIDGITKEGYLMKGPEIGNETNIHLIDSMMTLIVFQAPTGCSLISVRRASKGVTAI